MKIRVCFGGRSCSRRRYTAGILLLAAGCNNPHRIPGVPRATCRDNPVLYHHAGKMGEPVTLLLKTVEVKKKRKTAAENIIFQSIPS